MSKRQDPMPFWKHRFVRPGCVLFCAGVGILLVGCQAANPQFLGRVSGAGGEAPEDAGLAVLSGQDGGQGGSGGRTDLLLDGPVANDANIPIRDAPTDAGTAGATDAGPVMGMGRLKVTPLALGAGDVAVGASRTLSFSLSNIGAGPLQITESVPPAAKTPFAAASLLEVGAVIAPGASLVQRVVFSPSSIGAGVATWDIASDDGAASQRVTFRGTGAVGAAATSTWQFNGVAHAVSGGIEVTPVQQYSAGAAFWPVAVPTRKLEISFDMQMDMGTGGDGLTLTLLDGKADVRRALGMTGSGLGYGGLGGVGFCFVTFKNDSVAPSDNFVGLASGVRNNNVGLLNWVATSTAVPPLRVDKRSVSITLIAGTAKVWVDGTLAIAANPAALPTSAFIGFTAGSGSRTDRHLVTNVSIVVDGSDLPSP